MYDALSGPRKVAGTKTVAPMQAIWHASPVCQAQLHQPRGNQFYSMGRSKRGGDGSLWLLPEEALYLLERGTIEILYEGIPLSFQQAFMQMIGRNGISIERYQVYAYLKRLGYIVIRSSTFDGPKGTMTAVKPRRHFFSGLQQIISFIYRSIHDLLSRIYTTICTPFLTTSTIRSIIQPGLWSTYDSLFNRLRITSSKQLPSSIPPSQRFEITFDVYRPDSPYKKTSPGTPPFRIVVVDAQNTSIPTLHELGYLLSQVEPDAPDQIGPKSAKQRRDELGDKHKQSQKKPKERKEATVAATSTAPAQTLRPQRAKPPRQNFMPHSLDLRKLRFGQKGIIFACVDSGMISFMRFGDVEFNKQPLFGTA